MHQLLSHQNQQFSGKCCIPGHVPLCRYLILARNFTIELTTLRYLDFTRATMSFTSAQNNDICYPQTSTTLLSSASLFPNLIGGHTTLHRDFGAASNSIAAVLCHAENWHIGTARGAASGCAGTAGETRSLITESGVAVGLPSCNAENLE